MSHDAAMELVTAGAILGDLAPEEHGAYAAHRRWCLDCRRLERELDDVLADLALDATPRVPPATILPAILAGIRGEASPADGAPTASPASADAEPASLRGRGRRPVLAALALVAVLALAVAGLGARDLTRQIELDRANATVASLQSSLAGSDGAMTVAMNPSRVAVALHAEPLAPAAQAAVVYLPGSENAWIVARNLPATPAGHAYQLWFADAAGVHPLQVVPFDGSGPFVAPIDADLGSAAAVMITLEGASGAHGEPGPQVVFGEL
jgi:hypothetical protein